MAVKKKSKVVLSKKAKENVRVTRGTKDEEEVIKEGMPLEHSSLHQIPPQGSRVAGVNLGITKNMGAYESLRVDCWLTDVVAEDETQSEALARLHDIVLGEIERQVNTILEDEEEPPRKTKRNKYRR